MTLKKFLPSIPAWFTYILLLILALIPFCDMVGRSLFHRGIPDSTNYVRHIVLWITFLGGIITTKDGRHLAFTAGLEFMPVKVKGIIRSLTSFLTVMVTVALVFSSLSFALIGIDPGQKIGIFPMQYLLLVMPFSYLVMSVFFSAKAISEGVMGKILVFLGIAAGLVVGHASILEILGLVSGSAQLSVFIDKVSPVCNSILNVISLPGIIVLLVFLFLGAPIFVVLSGLALFFFTRSAGTIAVIPNEAYSILTSPAIVAIPLFTLAGFLLAGGKAGERLVALFKAFFGWMPGGMAMAAVLLCAFFTTFTGASGVTILALGGLLSFVMVNNGYSRNFSLGLLTASGSIGLLFPPSLPVIMFGVMAQVNIIHMYIAGLLPGLLMISTFMLLGLRHSLVNKTPRQPFKLKEALVSLKNAAWEVLLPIIIIVGYFSGYFTLVETGAVAAVYALISQTIIHKDINLKELPEILRRCLVLIGGVLVILSAAKGLSYYIVDTELPLHLVAWTQNVIHSKYVFLLLLNLVLILTGCIMDIFSAIIVVVPLILPLGKAFGIEPTHLGIIFLANMELGYLAPWVGLNLFISSYTFNEPLARLYKHALPFILVMLVNVLLITYLPWLTSVFLPK
jgi:C4-dicarboxylate transporter, DctM subunit